MLLFSFSLVSMITERALYVSMALPLQSVIALDRQVALVHFRQLVFITVLKPISFLQLVIHIPSRVKCDVNETANLCINGLIIFV